MNCPDPETLAAFIDGRLTGPERAAVVAHLADCDDCREVYAGAVEFEESTGASATVTEMPLRPRRWPLAAAVGAAAIAIVSLVVLTSPDPESASAEQVTERLLSSQGIVLPDAWQVLPWSNLRGDARSSGEATSEFRLGVLVTDLLVARRLELPTTDQLAGIARTLRTLPVADDLAIRAETLASGSPADETMSQLIGDLTDRAASPHYDLGRAVRAATLAAVGGDANLARSALQTAIALRTQPVPGEIEMIRRLRDQASAHGIDEETLVLFERLLE